MNMRIKKAFAARGPKISFMFLMLFLVIWSGIHFPWLAADGGNPTIYEYGYFTTDEGYYLGGAKEKLCFDKFVDVERGEAFAWSLSPGMSVLSWFSLRVFGQEYWAARLPFFILNLIAWLVLLRFLSRRTLPLFAFMLCAIAAFNPYMITYARTASTDVAMGSALIIAYCVGRGQRYRHSIIAGFIFGCAIWFKVSVYAFIPVAICTAFAVSSWRCRIIRVADFMGGFVAALGLYKLGLWMCLRNDAFSQNTTVAHLIQITKNSYPFPNLFDWSIYPIALGSFPRYPTSGFIGVFFVLSVLISGLLLLWRLFNGKLRVDHRSVLYAGVVLYAGAIAMMNTYYTHYYIPLMMLTPVILFEARRDLKAGMNVLPKSLVLLPSLVILGVVAFLFMQYQALPKDQIKSLFPAICNQYNLAKCALWPLMLKPLLVSFSLLLSSSLVFLYKRFRILPLVGLGLSCLGLVSVIMAQLPALAISKASGFYDKDIAIAAALSAMLSAFLLVVIWGVPKLFGQAKVWCSFIFVFFIIAIMINPVWRKGYKDLAIRSHNRRDASKLIATTLPENAIVIGECAPQVLFDTDIKPMSLANRNPVDGTLEFHKKHPQLPLYAICPADHFHLKSYVEAKDKIRLGLVKTFKLSGSGAFMAIDHYLVKIDIIGE